VSTVGLSEAAGHGAERFDVAGIVSSNSIVRPAVTATGSLWDERRAAPAPFRFIVGVLVFVVLCATASARADDVSVSDSRLVVHATTVATSVIDVEPDPLGFRVHDTTSVLRVGAGCELAAEPHEAVCGGLVLSVDFRGSGGRDLVGMWDLAIPVNATGGPGDDLLEGGSANDSIEGGDGNDALAGGRGDDRLSAGDQDDVVAGGAGADTLVGGTGDDILSGNAGNGDLLLGEEGQDLLRSGSGDATLIGGPGDDALVTGSGTDTVDTGSGSDEVFAGATKRLKLRCGTRDQVHSLRPRPQSPCPSVTPATAPPVAWPPLKTSAQASILVPDPSALAWPRHEGHATRFTVLIDTDAKQATKKRVCISLYDYAEHFLARFPKRVGTRVAHTYTRPHPPKASWYARARHSKHGCRRRGI
jgi:hypothetical protein